MVVYIGHSLSAQAYGNQLNSVIECLSWRNSSAFRNPCMNDFHSLGRNSSSEMWCESHFQSGSQPWNRLAQDLAQIKGSEALRRCARGNFRCEFSMRKAHCWLNWFWPPMLSRYWRHECPMVSVTKELCSKWLMHAWRWRLKGTPQQQLHPCDSKMNRVVPWLEHRYFNRVREVSMLIFHWMRFPSKWIISMLKPYISQ